MMLFCVFFFTIFGIFGLQVFMVGWCKLKPVLKAPGFTS